MSVEAFYFQNAGLQTQVFTQALRPGPISGFPSPCVSLTATHGWPRRRPLTSPLAFLPPDRRWPGLMRNPVGTTVINIKFFGYLPEDDCRRVPVRVSCAHKGG